MMSEKAIIALATAGAVVVVGYGISSGVSSAISDTGKGLKESLSGTGKAFENVGYGLGSFGVGAGYGVGQLGEGLGVGFAGIGQGVGGGVYEIGQGVHEVGRGVRDIGGGAGYALSGANVQDVVQTIVPWGKETSTYNTNQSQNQNVGFTGDVMPTASSSLGLKVFSAINPIGSWIVSQAKSLIAPKSSDEATSSTSSASSSSGGTSSSSLTSSKSSGTSSSSSFFEKIGWEGTSTPFGTTYSPPATTSTAPTSSLKSTKTWYKPWSWF